MKFKFHLPMILCFLNMAIFPRANGQTNGVPQVFLDRFDRAFEYTQAIAQAMPDSLYGFKPNEEIFSFGKQLQHGVKTVVRHTENYYLKQLSDDIDSRYSNDELDKEGVLTQLKLAHDEVRSVLRDMDAAQWNSEVEFFSGTFPAWHFFQILLDHLTHHRAMAIVYLRINGIAPPVRYVGW